MTNRVTCRAQLQGGISTREAEGRREVALEVATGLEKVLKCHLFHDVLRESSQYWV